MIQRNNAERGLRIPTTIHKGRFWSVSNAGRFWTTLEPYHINRANIGSQRLYYTISQKYYDEKNINCPELVLIVHRNTLKSKYDEPQILSFNIIVDST